MKVDSGFNLHLPDEVEISKSAYIFILARDFSHIHVALRNNSPAGICTNAVHPAEWDVRLRGAELTTCSPLYPLPRRDLWFPE